VRGGVPRHRRKGEDLVHALRVSLEDLYNGKTTKLALRKNVICSECHGKGANKRNAVTTCMVCKGSGITITLRQLGPAMVQQLQSVCKNCRGQGEVIRDQDKCKTCYGKKVYQEKKVLEVYIDKGMTHKQKIVFQGEGDQEPGAIPGDVIILVEEERHNFFVRRGEDLIMEKTVTLYEALCGFKFSVNHLDGRVLVVSSKPGDILKPGDVKEIVGEGMPNYRRPFDKGLLIIKFNIEFPEHISTTQAQMLGNIFEKPEDLDLDHVEDKNLIQEVTVAKYGNNKKKSQFKGNRQEAYQDDDEQAGRIDCTHQ